MNSETFEMKRGQYGTMLRLQKWLYLNVFIYPMWMLVVGFFMFMRFDQLGHLTKFLAVAVYTVSIFIELTRLYLGHYGNLSCRIPELAGFLMLSVLMQAPLISFFLLNPYLHSTPMEVTLHVILWMMILTESLLGYFVLKQASTVAKSIYLSRK